MLNRAQKDAKRLVRLVLKQRKRKTPLPCYEMSY